MLDDVERTRVRSGLRRWFRTPPRQHGEVDYRREVSNLELFYDLVYVVTISQASAHLGEHVGWAGVRDFAIVFGLIWLAWFNGTGWHELDGREDGRSRSYIFRQMGLIAVLAVFTGDATGADGRAFAITYAILFALYTWQWYLVRRIDEDPRYRPITTRYLKAMVVTVAALVASASVGESVRTTIWAVLVLAWVMGGLAQMSRDRTAGFGGGVTASMVERFGLFTIIVLGEVVIGVVDGMIDAPEREGLVIATGVVSLSVGMGLWWNYFDLLGRRVPGQQGGRLAGWMIVHLPIAASIAAAGAAMVGLVEHAGDPRTPTATAWLLAGSVAVALAGIALAVLALPADAFPPGVAPQIAPTFGLAALVGLVLAALRPAPIVLAAGVVAALLLAWLWLFAQHLAKGGHLPGDMT